jgi:hypothetical protein
MHSFAELIDRCTAFTLFQLNKANESIIAELQTSGATTLVKNLQMIRLQKAVMAVGMFSIFEAVLQDKMAGGNGFLEAKRILSDNDHSALLERFLDYQRAVNVLNHGRGQSYNYLIARHKQLTFKIKLPSEDFFNEGDVSEVTTLIDVDDEFLMGCARVIEDVTKSLREARPDVFS